MGSYKGGPQWRVTRVFPKAHSLHQQKGGWKVFTGDYANGNQCIGEGEYANTAWANAAKNLDKRKE